MGCAVARFPGTKYSAESQGYILLHWDSGQAQLSRREARLTKALRANQHQLPSKLLLTHYNTTISLDVNQSSRIELAIFQNLWNSSVHSLFFCRQLRPASSSIAFFTLKLALIVRRMHPICWLYLFRPQHPPLLAGRQGAFLNWSCSPSPDPYYCCTALVHTLSSSGSLPQRQTISHVCCKDILPAFLPD